MTDKQDFWIINDQVKQNAVNFIIGLYPDEKNPSLVRIQDLKHTRSVQQNNLLNGVIYKQISEYTGSTRDEIHNKFTDGYKKRFALPIFIRDDPEFCDMVQAIRAVSLRDKEQGFMLARNVLKLVSTSNFNTKQMAEFITEVLNDCYNKNINIVLNTEEKKLLRF